MENFIIEFLPKSIGFQFLFNQSKRNIWLIERNSQLIKTHKTEFFENFLATVFDSFFAILYQKTPFDYINEDLQMKQVFKIKFKNPNNAKNFENIILISLGINFIKGF